MTTLHGPTVYLRDLFDDAGAGADRVLGPGPEPGGRIVVEAAQLNAIARQYNVEWRSGLARRSRGFGMAGPPATQGGSGRCCASRASRPRGASAEIDIDLSGFHPADRSGGERRRSLPSRSLNTTAAAGVLRAALTLTGDAMNPIDTRISGRVEQVVEAPVALTRLLPETILRAG